MSGVVVAWDTSTNTGVAAAGADGRVLCEREFPTEKGHTGRLMLLVDSMLSELDSGPSDIESIVIGTGPGNFTGVKVGVATAKGMSLGLGVPLAGVPTLDLLAGAGTGGGQVVSIMDARRATLYARIFNSSTGESEYVCETLEEIARLVASLPGEEVTLAGWVPEELSSMVEKQGKQVVVVPREPKAARLLEMYFAGLVEPGDAFSVLPLYLKRPV